MPDSLTGSCLCGQVAFEVQGEAKRFYHCHCSRCRKASGTGHASNVIVPEPESMKWTRGEDQLGTFQPEGAKYFYSSFCGNCGSPMPRFSEERGMAVIPAGALDVEPGIKPQARIFWDSRQNWSCSDDDELPVFETYPS